MIARRASGIFAATFLFVTPATAATYDYAVSARCVTPSKAIPVTILTSFTLPLYAENGVINDYVVVSQRDGVTHYTATPLFSGLFIDAAAVVRGSTITLTGTFACNELVRVVDRPDNSQTPVVAGFRHENRRIEITLGTPVVITDSDVRLELKIVPGPQR
ncbi:hypothetical protein [Azospirillum argentinense]|uniref:hypothetical protein n=1 Tax=Azospirillum argentinense TaxID=2970906 RepID=UPI0032DE416F